MKLQKIFITIMTVCLLFCTGCEKIENSSSKENYTGENQMVHGAAAGILDNFSVTENGMYYLTANGLRYYDFGNDTSYPVCARANCTHMSEKCNAYYDEPGSVTGLAEVEGFLYALRKNRDNNSYDLVRTDTVGEGRKVVSSIDIGDNIPGNWVITSIYSDVYYCGGMAWLTTCSDYVESEEKILTYQAEQFIGIDLKTGKQVIAKDRETDGSSCSYEGISKKYVIMKKTFYKEAALSEDEFYDVWSKGELEDDEILSNKENPYDAYLSEWYPAHTAKYYAYLCYDVEAGTTRTLAEGEIDREENPPPYMFLDTMDETSFLVEAVDWNKENGKDESVIYVWDVESNQKREVWKIGAMQGDIYGVCETGSVFDSIISENEWLYLSDRGNDLADMNSYNLKTGESTYLFEDTPRVTFRLIGRSGDRIIGRIYEADKDDYKIYWISKEDYYQGNFDEKHRIRI